MKIFWKIFNNKNITPQEIYDILFLRNQVFIVEQKCSYQDIDGIDLKSDTLHIVGYTENYDKIIIGRVIIHSSMRGMKLGHQMMTFIINTIKKLYPNKSIFLSAQAHLQDFYATYGFLKVSEIYLEDNIPHIDMCIL